MQTLTCLINSREITADMPNCPKNALHVYRSNVDVDSRNIVMSNSLASLCEKYSIEASDVKAPVRVQTGGLHSVLKLAIDAWVMLITNVDVSDGLASQVWQ